MNRASPSRFASLRRQRGQALIYGIFVLLAGLASLFFMFNTGQLASEKTKLVNTADAVAYSAGVMHARALNFDAYTNRALMANEVTIAQMVSISSWINYAQDHSTRARTLNCFPNPIWSVPAGLRLLAYTPLCWAIVSPAGAAAITWARNAINIAAPVTMAASELAKANLQLAQASMFLALLPARTRLMQEVADANYSNDGTIQVDAIPMTDNYTLFDGGPFIRRYSGNDRTRFREVELTSARNDGFVAQRNWNDSSVPGLCIPIRGKANHAGSTTLSGFDAWTANDSANMNSEALRGFFPRCRTIQTWNLGRGNRVANRSAGAWFYSGVPSFFDLSPAALAYSPSNSNVDRRDPHLRFAIRLTRSNTQARTSMGTSGIKPSGRMDLYDGAEARDVMAAVATSEVFFERPEARAGGRRELASLFNPYWQVRLVGNSSAVVAAAIALQQGAGP
ncbi:MAG: pilus assembly protein TadG-related protein [Pseudomonadota bacterium]